MQSKAVRDMLRKEIFGKSIQILRLHGKSACTLNPVV